MAQKIPIDESELIRLYIDEDLSALKIGDIYNCSETTILKRLRQLDDSKVFAKQNFRKKLEGSCPVCNRTHLEVTLKRFKGTAYCEAHYVQLSKKGNITNVRLYNDCLYENCGDFVEMTLIDKKGNPIVKTKITPEKVELARQYMWYYSCDYITGRKHNDGSTIFLHRVVYGEVPDGMVIDHISGDKLDNRNDNLRACTQGQNQMNSRLERNNSSGRKGVSLDTRRGKWMSSIVFEGKVINLGRFNQRTDAVKAREDAERLYFGDFARKY